MAALPNIVLVHGAWADGSCWSEVIERLQADGQARPSVGTLTRFDLASGPGIRVDTHGQLGASPSPHYDSLLAKLVVHVPGDFAHELGEDRTWTGWNATRTVWFHAVGYTKPDGTRPGPEESVAVGRRSLPDGDAVPGVNRLGLRGEAVFGETTDEDERRVWRLSGVTAADGQLVVCHVYSESAADRDWAVETWHSLRHDG